MGDGLSKKAAKRGRGYVGKGLSGKTAKQERGYMGKRLSGIAAKWECAKRETAKWEPG